VQSLLTKESSDSRSLPHGRESAAGIAPAALVSRVFGVFCSVREVTNLTAIFY